MRISEYPPQRVETLIEDNDDRGIRRDATS
jgi:hypothetical protein